MSVQRSYYGQSYDRYLESNENSTIHKMKETYWTTKQAVIKKLGKKEDEHVVASDAQLDAKLEVFKAIQKSSMELLRVIERYQDRICIIAQEENCMGRFLKSQGSQDKTRAGKMMAAVGKSQSFSAQQRLALRVPLVRLYQEVETFRYRAISDTLMTINRMEGARTEYRGALLWMKASSEELDPDTFKQLDKFRKVQAQVRKTKARFDKLKLDVMQKVDLLAASRCNMFSHVLANYQSTLLHFWEKTSRTMNAVSESFKGYQYYEFSMLKELVEPSRKLAEKTSSIGLAEQLDDDFDPEKLLAREDNKLLANGISKEADNDTKHSEPEANYNLLLNKSEPLSSSHERLIMFDDDNDEIEKAISAEADSILPSSDREKASSKSPALGDIKNSLFKDTDEDDRLPIEDFDFSSRRRPDRPTAKDKKSNVPDDLLMENYEVDEVVDKDDLALLNEILNSNPATDDNDFAREWTSVFGDGSPASTNGNMGPSEADHPGDNHEYMPSCLLDMTAGLGQLNLGTPEPVLSQAPVLAPMKLNPATVTSGTSQINPKAGPQATGGKEATKKPTGSKKNQKGDMSAWFNLFADLDPLSNPDAVGKSKDELTDACM